MKARKEGRPDDEHHGYDAEKLLDVGNDRFIPYGCVETDLIKRRAGKIEPPGPTHFLLTVDVIHIFVRHFPDTLVADLYQIVKIAEGKDFLRTDLHTGWRFAVFQAGGGAKDAFLDYRVKCAGIAVGRNVEGTGNHAGAAADAGLGVVDYCPFIGFGVGIDKT